MLKSGVAVWWAVGAFVIPGCAGRLGQLENTAKITLNCKDSPIVITEIAKTGATHQAEGCGRRGTYEWDDAAGTWKMVGF